VAKEGLISELNSLFSGFLENKGFELVELLQQFSGPKLGLTVLVDKPPGDGLASTGQSHKPTGGISLQECAQICKELKNLLEEKNIIEADYILEVASPGLDRPLKSGKDFKRSAGKGVVFFLNDAVDGRIQWQGVVQQVDENSVFIQAKDKVLGIPLIKINKARLVI
jgi:ribosome maturation factor RimP